MIRSFADYKNVKENFTLTSQCIFLVLLHAYTSQAFNTGTLIPAVSTFLYRDVGKLKQPKMTSTP